MKSTQKSVSAQPKCGGMEGVVSHTFSPPDSPLSQEDDSIYRVQIDAFNFMSLDSTPRHPSRQEAHKPSPGGCSSTGSLSERTNISAGGRSLDAKYLQGWIANEVEQQISKSPIKSKSRSNWPSPRPMRYQPQLPSGASDEDLTTKLYTGSRTRGNPIAEVSVAPVTNTPTSAELSELRALKKELAVMQSDMLRSLESVPDYKAQIAGLTSQLAEQQATDVVRKEKAQEEEIKELRRKLAEHDQAEALRSHAPTPKVVTAEDGSFNPVYGNSEEWLQGTSSMDQFPLTMIELTESVASDSGSSGLVIQSTERVSKLEAAMTLLQEELQMLRSGTDKALRPDDSLTQPSETKPPLSLGSSHTTAWASSQVTSLSLAHWMYLPAIDPSFYTSDSARLSTQSRHMAFLDTTVQTILSELVFTCAHGPLSTIEGSLTAIAGCRQLVPVTLPTQVCDAGQSGDLDSEDEIFVFCGVVVTGNRVTVSLVTREAILLECANTEQCNLIPNSNDSIASDTTTDAESYKFLNSLALSAPPPATIRAILATEAHRTILRLDDCTQASEFDSLDFTAIASVCAAKLEDWSTPHTHAYAALGRMVVYLQRLSAHPKEGIFPLPLEGLPLSGVLPNGRHTVTRSEGSGGVGVLPPAFTQHAQTAFIKSMTDADRIAYACALKHAVSTKQGATLLDSSDVNHPATAVKKEASSNSISTNTEASPGAEGLLQAAADSAADAENAAMGAEASLRLGNLMYQRMMTEQGLPQTTQMQSVLMNMLQVQMQNQQYMLEQAKRPGGKKQTSLSDHMNRHVNKRLSASMGVPIKKFEAAERAKVNAPQYQPMLTIVPPSLQSSMGGAPPPSFHSSMTNSPFTMYPPSPAGGTSMMGGAPSPHHQPTMNGNLAPMYSASCMGGRMSMMGGASSMMGGGSSVKQPMGSWTAASMDTGHPNENWSRSARLSSSSSTPLAPISQAVNGWDSKPRSARLSSSASTPLYAPPTMQPPTPGSTRSLTSFRSMAPVSETSIIRPGLHGKKSSSMMDLQDECPSASSKKTRKFTGSAQSNPPTPSHAKSRNTTPTSMRRTQSSSNPFATRQLQSSFGGMPHAMAYMNGHAQGPPATGYNGYHTGGYSPSLLLPTHNNIVNARTPPRSPLPTQASSSFPNLNSLTRVITGASRQRTSHEFQRQ